MRILNVREYTGKNIYCYRPIVKIILDLEGYAEKWSDQVAGFKERLCSLLPGLMDHHCSRGYDGGFIERLKLGTGFGHVVEHVAIELQVRAGQEVYFGKTIMLNDHTCEVIIEAPIIEVGIEALKRAVRLVEDTIQGEKVEVLECIKILQRLAEKYGYGPSTTKIIEECRRRDIPVIPLGFGSLLQLGYGKYQKRIQATMTSHTSSIAVDIACNKDLAKKILRENGFPVPRGRLVMSADNAVDEARYFNGSVVIKPVFGNQGKGVYVDLQTEQEIRTAYSLAAEYGKVMVEEYIQGNNYRLLVVGNRMVAAALRIPAYIVGDGKHNIKELVEIINNNPQRGDGHEKPLTKIKINANSVFVLAKQKKTFDSVPQKDEIVYICGSSNLSTGGIAVDVTDKVNQYNIAVALRTARTIGLDVCGIDFVCKDIGRPLSEGGVIIEINASPGIRMHHNPTNGQSRNVAGNIVNYLFPQENKVRIPIISITGTNGKTTTARLTAYILKLWGKCVGLTTTGGIYVNEELLQKGDTTGPQSAKNILKDARIDTAVFETARGGIIRAGIGYDKARVGVVTNISNDHLGSDGIEEIEQLAMVKSLVVEALEDNGTAVLNADDRWCTFVSARVRNNLIYYSIAEDNILIKRHLSTGQKALFIKNNSLILAEGENSQKVIDIKDMPLGMKGLAKFNIANALAATAASHSVGVPISVIREGLMSFGRRKNHNPGRCQIYDIGGVKVILDYGHNAHAFENVLEFARRLNPERLIGVIGVPGDRRDEDIVHTGYVAGKKLDFCIIKEDKDLRGRMSGETAGLLSEGVQSAGCGEGSWQIVLDEVAACLRAINTSEPGDIVVLFYERLNPLQDILEKFEKAKIIKEIKGESEESTDIKEKNILIY